VVPLDPTDPAAGPPAEVPPLDVAVVVDVRATLACLSPEHRAILVLRDLEGWTESEVAQALAIPTGTAKSRLARARAAFVRRWAS
ncbi:MAG: sigma factor-like helix-turn-helix DNA-binding protein, partial [Acidimicrobiia bacterium]